MSKLFELFVGEYVRVTLSKGLKQTIQHNGNFKTIDTPNEVDGFLIEECPDNFYLGTPDGDVTTAVNKFEYSKVEIIDPNQEKTDMFNELHEMDEKPGSMN